MGDPLSPSRLRSSRWLPPGAFVGLGTMVTVGLAVKLLWDAAYTDYPLP